MDVNRGVSESLPGTKTAQVPTEGTEVAGYEDTEDAPAEEERSEGTLGIAPGHADSARHPGALCGMRRLVNPHTVRGDPEAFGKKR